MSVGTVVRLQVQRSPLKPGPAGARVYDPSPLVEVDALEVGPRGCVGLIGGQRLLDVHHAEHPLSRNRGDNPLSLLTTHAHDELVRRYGPHLVPGAAGESVLLAVPGEAGLPAGDLLVETDDGELLLTEVQPAPPCVEFSRFCLQRGTGDTGEQVRATLLALGGGARGWYATPAGSATIRPGAPVSSARGGSRRAP